MPSANTITIAGVPDNRGRKRVHKNDAAKKRAYRRNKNQVRIENIATLDFETTPFDNTKPDVPILPFTACLYFGPSEPAVHFWNDDATELVNEIYTFLEELSQPYTIYAHNGGKFDFRFMMHLISGKCVFIGSSLLKANIDKHEIRDSLRILPMALRDYKKDDFDYSILTPEKRNLPDNRRMISEYMENDCAYLYDMVVAFNARFDGALTVGQAGLKLLENKYTIGKLSAAADATLREYFWGGRVDCVQGLGHFYGDYKLYDRNSMYPAEMALTKHPIGNEWIVRSKGLPNENTCFIDLACRQRGAFPTYSDEGLLNFEERYGRFKITIHEFNMAQELGLISHVKIHKLIDSVHQSTFADYILPLYEERFKWKDLLTEMRARGIDSGLDYDEAFRQDLLVKFVLNASYGKFAWNPRKAKETFVRPYTEGPPPPGFEDQDFPRFWNETYEVWEKPTVRQRFNNVATAASITGAARANLLGVLYKAESPIYCDTDSVICKALPGVEMDGRKLGAWDLEAEFDEVLIAGKKLYACRKYKSDGTTKDKVRAKGQGDMTFDEVYKLVHGESVTRRRKGVTISRDGSQIYLERTARATVKPRVSKFDIFGRMI